MLFMTVQGHEPYQALIRSGHAHIVGKAKQAMAHSVNGAHTAAAKSLMMRGTETLNAMVELAGIVLKRHAAKIDGGAGMVEMIGDVKRKFCSKATQVALGGAGSRAAGALTIRS
jgi:hypothetical protein